MNNFIKTTVLGGIVFLVPLIAIVVLLGKALSAIHELVTPVLTHLEVDNILGASFVHLAPLLLLILLCFLAGLAAQTPVMGRAVRALDDILREKISGYALFRAKTSAINPAETDRLKPVMVRFDDSLQLAFDVGEASAGKKTIFLPGSPDPWSGSVCIVDVQRVSVIDASVNDVNQIMKRLGRGAATLAQKQ